MTLNQNIKTTKKMKIEKSYHKNSNILKWERITHSNGYNSERTYNKQGEELTFKDSNGSSYEHTYNEQGQVLTFKHSSGSSFERTYNEQGQQLTFKDSDDFSCEHTYNEQGKVLTYKDSNGTYEIKGKEVTKEEFDSFVNDDIIELKEQHKKDIVGLDHVSQRTLDINTAAAIIKSMPTSTAIQQIKSKLSGQPETVVISGKLVVVYVA